MKMIDWARAVDFSIPGASWGRSETYNALKDSWTDTRPIPTKSELEQIDADLTAKLESRKVWDTAFHFLGEFTQSELIAASKIPDLSGMLLLLSTWVGEVWSDDDRITEGLNAMVFFGVLTTERKKEICQK